MRKVLIIIIVLAILLPTIVQSFYSPEERQFIIEQIALQLEKIKIQIAEIMEQIQMFIWYQNAYDQPSK